MAKNLICEACLGKEYRVFYSPPDLAVCFNCGFIWQIEVGNLVVYDQVYHDKYLAYPEGRLSVLRAELVEAVAVKQYGAILDFGYNTGAFLREMDDRAWLCYGVEINESAKKGKPWLKDVSKLLWPAKLDVVTFFDSLEHLSHPSLPMRLAADRAKTVVISIPDPRYTVCLDSFREWRHFRPDEHLSYFSQGNLIRFMRRFSFKPVLFTNVEDIVRRPQEPRLANILTGVFERC